MDGPGEEQKAKAFTRRHAFTPRDQRVGQDHRGSVNLNHHEILSQPSQTRHRVVTQIVSAAGANEYRVWIFREFNIIYADAFHKGVEANTKLFRGPLTRRSLESISRILRRSQP